MVRSVILPGDRQRNYSKPILQYISVHEKIEYRHGNDIQRPLFPVDGVSHDIRQKKNDHTRIAKARNITDSNRYDKFYDKFAHKFRVVVAFHREHEDQASEQHHSSDGKHPVLGRYAARAEQKVKRSSLIYISPKRMARDQSDKQYDQQIEQDQYPEHKYRDLTYFFQISFYSCCFFYHCAFTLYCQRSTL